MTAVQILEIVDKLNFSADHARDWLLPGGVCCGGPREHDYCTRFACVKMREHYAVYWTRQAAHRANQLLDLAEKGRCAA